MSTKVAGSTAYQILTGYNSNLTDLQAAILTEEYAKLGLSFRKGIREGKTCLFVRSSAQQFEEFDERRLSCWREIFDRAGIDGLMNSRSNTYRPGVDIFRPDSDWYEVVSFIDSQYDVLKNDAHSGKKSADSIELAESQKQPKAEPAIQQGQGQAIGTTLGEKASATAPTRSVGWNRNSVLGIGGWFVVLCGFAWVRAMQQGWTMGEELKVNGIIGGIAFLSARYLSPGIAPALLAAGTALNLDGLIHGKWQWETFASVWVLVVFSTVFGALSKKARSAV